MSGKAEDPEQIEGADEQPENRASHPPGAQGDLSKPRRGSPANEAGPQTAKSKRKPKDEFQDVEPRPLLRGNLIYERAHRLATLPRKRIDEFTQSALWAAIATGTPGIAGLVDINSPTPAQPKMLDVAEIVIFAICVALTVTGCFRNSKTELSGDYLDSLYGLAKPQKPVAPKQRFWNRSGAPT